MIHQVSDHFMHDEFMKVRLQKTLSPILNIFESGDGEFNYKSSHRAILVAVGALFLLLSLASLIAAFYTAQLGGLVSFIVFFALGAVCEIVAILGSDRAVAKIWGNT